MITSIKLTGKHTVRMAGNKFLMGEDEINIKEVPFVRYKFDSYSDEELKYIRKVKETFKYSSHMLEIDLDENTSELLDKIEDAGDNVIKFVYVGVTDAHVLNGFDEETIDLLYDIEECEYDRIMLYDKSSSLHALAAERLKKEIEEATDFEARDIGVCNSPLSFNGGACLTAVKARELLAEYAENDEIPLPSANHECMNTCGCIRFGVISGDTDAPKCTKKVKGKAGKKAKGNKSKKSKSASKGVQMMQF